LPPEQAAQEAETSLRKVAGAELSLPRLDLVILGMGEDGHVASLFPAGLQPSPGAGECFRAVVGPKPPPNRVTMTWELLTCANQVLVLVSGPGKEAALANALALNDMNPLSRLLRLRSHTTILSTVRSKEFPRSFCLPNP
jgi:6-phosphogluconolactonase